jgi:molybdopterin-guanine dinucleotide biosynthesis protein A
MWSAAILAGGRAQRFGGCDKSALVVGGRSIRERQMMALATLTTDILIVGSPRLIVGSPLGTARVVADRLPGCGPLGGLHTAFCEAHGDAIIVIACDMPYVSAPFLRRLLTLTRDADAVVPRTECGYHPLCAAYTRACLAPAAARLAQGRLKMIDLLEDVRVRVVTTEEVDAFGHHGRLLANVNTPAEYGDLEAFQGHQL